ncbi:8-oxoguanine DNA glycosylase OGG fold protein [Nocardia camponoti]|uniref:Uncharacterized protein n=1 Tax=Nocardia camponoti TaxID=1616106 RepID=A0A917QMT8_9NOCA|nr:hypothetical protein [Nocardia camponoti]GGK58190.1 hypothetical protein GCM10011591_33020 [Nocardia camponoti]
MRTDTTTLDVPTWLIQDAERLEEISTPLRVAVSWWKQRLANAGLEDEMFDASGTLDREAIFAIAADGIDDGPSARKVLWAALAWGEGNRVFRNPRRVAAVLDDLEVNGKLLVEAANAADPETGYRTLFGAIKGLGPAFFTKYLYFANPDRFLILDQRVATALHNECGWTSLSPTTSWPPDTYARYCELLTRWAAELSEAGFKTSPDQLEYRLFERTFDDS